MAITKRTIDELNAEEKNKRFARNREKREPLLQHRECTMTHGSGMTRLCPECKALYEEEEGQREKTSSDAVLT